MSGPTLGSRRATAPSRLASVAWGCAVLLLASCAGEEVPAGLRPVGEDGFEVAIDEPRLRVDRSGIWVAGDGEPTLVLAAARLERGGVPVDEADLGALSLEPNRGSYPRGELGEEWYELRDGHALEQGWSLTAPPGERAGGPLEVVLDFGSDIELTREDGHSVEVRFARGQVTCSDLVARDAIGTPLTATMATRGRSVVLSVDDSRAEYPIEIDPLYAFISNEVSPPSPSPDYGYSVSVDGTNLVVGQPDLAAGGGFIEGAVHYFTLGTNGLWNRQATIRMPGTGTTAAFGTAVDVDGDWLVAGAPFESGGGRVYAIKLSGGFVSGVPSVYRQLSTTDPILTFGWSVSISGSRLAIGGSFMDNVYVFNRSGDNWTTTASHVLTGDDRFGISVALSRGNANILVVGAPAYMTNGRVFIYRWNGSTWGTPTTIAPLASPTQQTRFGTSVSVSGALNQEHVAIGCLSSSGTRAQLVRTTYATGSGWSSLSVPITGTANGYLSTTDTYSYGSDIRSPHVAIAPDSSIAGSDMLLLALPNAVASSAGTGTVVGTHIALPDDIENVERALTGTITGHHRGRSIATDGATVVVGRQGGTAPIRGYVDVHRIAWDNGTPCTSSTASQCASGLCVDGFCCNSSCGNGATTDCQACSVALGASEDGTCRTLPSTTTCRASAGTCDVAEMCTGGSVTCPANTLKASGTVCRAAVSLCDTAETCNGTAATCPANAPALPAGTVCRAANASLGCDAQETCNGTAYTCPADAAAATGTTCRASAGTCDLPESCNGSFTCPTDVRVAAGTSCRSSAGACDVAEVCNGGVSCPADVLVTAGTVCRSAAAGTCDRAETCSGASALCPTDTPQPAGTACGSDTGDPCDAPDSCNGSSFVCPELYTAAGTVCRAAVSGCDTAETCTGSTLTCPANAPARPAGTVCRAANPSLLCDAQETCNGTAYTCPADAPLASGSVCRAAAGGCDLAEVCAGSSFTCPTDLRRPAGTVCRAASTSTPPGGSDCDVAELCDGTAAACPADLGASFAQCCVTNDWADGDQCRTDYLCVDATCTVRGCGDAWLEGSEICDDGNYVDGDACSSDCAPTPFVVAGRTDGIDEPDHRSVAIDGEGRVLVVWSEEGATTTRVRARRYTRYGTDPSGTPAITEIASLPGPGWDAQPVVTALEDGWAVAWRQPAAAEVGAVAVARISETGVLGAAIRVSATGETLALDPGIAALSDGALIVTWTDATDPTTPIIRYRWIVGSSVSGLPTALDSAAGGDPVVAASGTTAMIVWTEEPALGGRPRVVARRITRTLPIDVTKVEIATSASQPTVSGGASHFAIGWVGRQDDPDGDIFARVAPLTGAITAPAVHVTDSMDADRPHIERAPTILAHGSGWIVAWEVPTELSARVAAGGGVTLPTELTTTLEPALTDYLAGDLSLAASSRGTWVVWSAAHEPVSGAARATWAFILPPS